MRMMEDLVDGESTSTEEPSSRKRRFEEIDSDNHVDVKTERSMSSGSSLSATSNSSIDNVKTEFEPQNTVDEETSNAASILNEVALDRRTVIYLRNNF